MGRAQASRMHLQTSALSSLDMRPGATKRIPSFECVALGQGNVTKYTRRLAPFSSSAAQSSNDTNGPCFGARTVCLDTQAAHRLHAGERLLGCKDRCLDAHAACWLHAGERRCHDNRVWEQIDIACLGLSHTCGDNSATRRRRGVTEASQRRHRGVTEASQRRHGKTNDI